MYIIEPTYDLSAIPKRALSSMVAQMYGDALYRVVYNNLLIFATGSDRKPHGLLCVGFVFTHNGEYFLCTSDSLKFIIEEGEHILIRGTSGTEMMIVETCYSFSGQQRFSVTCQFSPDNNDDLSFVSA